MKPDGTLCFTRLKEVIYYGNSNKESSVRSTFMVLHLWASVVPSAMHELTGGFKFSSHVLLHKVRYSPLCAACVLGGNFEPARHSPFMIQCY